MTNDLRYKIENQYILDLLQAMIGSISNNFRASWIKVKDGNLEVFFLLEEDNQKDREEIEEIIFEFEALQDKVVDVTSHIIINEKKWSPPPETRIIFAKK